MIKFRQVLLTGLLLILLTASASMTVAQQVTTEDDGPASTIEYFVVICENQAVVNFSGTMQAGYDIFYQIFSGPGGTGAALTNLRQASVNGAYSFSETVPYGEGTVPAGSVGSAYVAIARSDNAQSTIFSDYVNDLQDGCTEPQQAPGTSVDTGATTPSEATPSTPASPILSPFGGVINPGYVPPDKPLVQIGARDEWVKPRQETAGLIFAECNDYPIAEPGVVYDTDTVIVFWSWYARTPELVQEHIDTVDYSVTFHTSEVILPNVVRTEIEQRGSNYWVFYYSNLGNLAPGEYNIRYMASWDRAISDGYEEFGPGTENDLLVSQCYFQITPNPEGRSVPYTRWPLFPGSR